MSPEPRIPESEIEAVRAGAAIDTVIGAYVHLRPAGPTNFKGLCPFHPEQTPSLHVSPDRGLFHCFGCGQGGDVFTFLAKIEHLDFPDAVALAAHRIGHRLRLEGGGPSAQARHGTRTRLLAANTAAAEFYRTRLHDDPDARTARTYLDQRGFHAPIIDTFGCGFAPTAWDTLTRHLLGRGFTLTELEAAGLSRPGTRGPIDRFRARLLWPIRNANGEVLGFGARRLFDDDRIDAKYLNTPETVLYKKSHVLFGIDHARRPIGDTHHAIVVEGYTDVMAMHAAGITNVVAACGTAFGPHHHYTLRRILHDDSPWRAEITYTFDGDAAGIKAATHALDHVKTTPGRSSVAIAPDGTDPCELRQRDGDQALHQLLHSRTPLVEYVLRTALTEHDLTTVEGRIAAMHHGSAVLAALPDPVTRSEYTRQLATWVGVDPDAAAPPTTSEQHNDPGTVDPDERARAPGTSSARWQRIALQAALQYPELAARCGFDDLPSEAFDPPYHAVRQSISTIRGTGAVQADRGDRPHGPAAVPESDGLARELTLDPVSLPDSEPDSYLRGVFTLISAVHLQNRVDQLRAELDSTSALDDPDRFHQLIAEIQRTDGQRRATLATTDAAPPHPRPITPSGFQRSAPRLVPVETRRRRL